jgi:hypothetical protein
MWKISFLKLELCLADLQTVPKQKAKIYLIGMLENNLLVWLTAI